MSTAVSGVTMRVLSTVRKTLSQGLFESGKLKNRAIHGFVV